MTKINRIMEALIICKERKYNLNLIINQKFIFLPSLLSLKLKKFKINITSYSQIDKNQVIYHINKDYQIIIDKSKLKEVNLDF